MALMAASMTGRGGSSTPASCGACLPSPRRSLLAVSRTTAENGRRYLSIAGVKAGQSVKPAGTASQAPAPGSTR